MDQYQPAYCPASLFLPSPSPFWSWYPLVYSYAFSHVINVKINKQVEHLQIFFKLLNGDFQLLNTLNIACYHFTDHAFWHCFCCIFCYHEKVVNSYQLHLTSQYRTKNGSPMDSNQRRIDELHEVAKNVTQEFQNTWFEKQ